MDVGGREEALRPRPSGRRATTRPARARLAALALPVLLVPSVATVDGARAAGSTFVVDSLSDAPDASTVDGVCATATTPVRCTLRAAIEQANASPGHDRIEFALPGPGPHRFTPASRYPVVTDPAGLTIDGYSQPGAAPNTALHGSNAVIGIELRGQGPTQIDGIELRSAGNVVRGLALYDFRLHIRLYGAAAVDNEIVGNFIGTDAGGSFAQTTRSINSSGVHLERGASDNRIGTPGRGNRNVISGNGDRGIGIFDPGTDGNTIRNNVIGLTPDGSRLRNWGHGIDINYNASDNVTGGHGSGERNVISGNELSGVEISHDRGTTGSTSGNDVVGNFIGTSLDGTRGDDGTRNHEFGVNLEGRGECEFTCPPDISDNLVEANRIVGSAAGVMIWKGAHDNVVRANTIGLLPNGTIAPSAANTLWGVLIETGAFDNLVEANTIAGGRDGIQVRPDNDYTNLASNPDFPTYGNTFRRNSIWGVTDGFGIDIAPIGEINDEPSELDADVQGGIRRPTVIGASADVVSVSTCSRCRVELFVADSTSSSPQRPGRTFLLAQDADAFGLVSIVLRATSGDPFVVRAGTDVTATATDGAGNTSEFAPVVTVVAGSLAPPGVAPLPLERARRCGTRC